MREYNLYDALCRSRHGVVYKARKRKTVLHVAIKQYDKLLFREHAMRKVLVTYLLLGRRGCMPPLPRTFRWVARFKTK